MEVYHMKRLLIGISILLIAPVSYGLKSKPKISVLEWRAAQRAMANFTSTDFSQKTAAQLYESKEAAENLMGNLSSWQKHHYTAQIEKKMKQNQKTQELHLAKRLELPLEEIRENPATAFNEVDRQLNTIIERCEDIPLGAEHIVFGSLINDFKNVEQISNNFCSITAPDNPDHQAIKDKFDTAETHVATKIMINTNAFLEKAIEQLPYTSDEDFKAKVDECKECLVDIAHTQALALPINLFNKPGIDENNLIKNNAQHIYTHMTELFDDIIDGKTSFHITVDTLPTLTNIWNTCALLGRQICKPWNLLEKKQEIIEKEVATRYEKLQAIRNIILKMNTPGTSDDASEQEPTKAEVSSMFATLLKWLGIPAGLGLYEYLAPHMQVNGQPLPVLGLREMIANLFNNQAEDQADNNDNAQAQNQEQAPQAAPAPNARAQENVPPVVLQAPAVQNDNAAQAQPQQPAAAAQGQPRAAEHRDPYNQDAQNPIMRFLTIVGTNIGTNILMNVLQNLM
jgi:hypothetical protein